MRDILPFADFLAFLRERDFPVGLHEYNALSRLTAGWKGTDPQTFGDALAALFARDQDDVAAIRRLFDEWVTPIEQPTPTPPPAPRTEVKAPRRWMPWVIAAAVALVIMAIVLFSVRKPPSPPVDDELLPYTEPDRAEAVIPPAPEPPVTHVKPSRANAIRAAVGLALLVLVILAGRRANRRMAEWLRRYWREVLSRIPGPYHYRQKIRRGDSPISRDILEQAATTIGRARDEEHTGRQLDVEESLRRTLRAGMCPHLVFIPPANNIALLVLEDTGTYMRPWRPKVEALIEGLSKHGVSVDRWVFSGDPVMVSRSRFGRVIPLDELAANTASSLLVISTGDGLRPRSMQRTADALARWPYRTWLNPIRQASYARGDLQQLPIRVWPMTPAGIIGAATELARTQEMASTPEETALNRTVNADDLARMKRLIAIVPHPTLELAAELRRRFCPDIPEEVLLFLDTEGVFHREHLQITEEDRAIIASRRHEPRVPEQQVRRYLLDMLRASEPPPDSVAHLRWRLDQSMHLLHGTEDEHRAAETTLLDLGRGPLREEVRARLPSMPRSTRRMVERVISASVTGSPGRVLGDAPSARLGSPPRAVWPLPRHFLMAAVAGSLLFGGWIGVAGNNPRVLPNRYLYEVESNDSTLVIARKSAEAPANATIYRGLQPWRNSSLTMPQTIPVQPADSGAWFHVRATLPEKNFALSESVWIPKRISTSGPPATPLWEPQDAIEERIRRVVARFAPAAKIEPTATLDKDLGIGALGAIAIAAEINRTFELGRSFSFDTSKTVSDLVAAVRLRIGDRPIDAILTLNFTYGSNDRVVAGTIYRLRSTSDRAAISGRAGEPVDVPPGEWTVRASAPPYDRERLTTRLSVASGSKQSLLITLPMPVTRAYIDVLDVPPGVDRNAIYIRPADSRHHLAPSWLGWTMKIMPGSYVVGIDNQFYDAARNVSVEANETKSVSFLGAAATRGVAQVTMSPINAIASPLDLSVAFRLMVGEFQLSAAPGDYRVAISASEHQNQTIVVRVVAGQTTKSTVSLRPRGQTDTVERRSWFNVLAPPVEAPDKPKIPGQPKGPSKPKGPGRWTYTNEVWIAEADGFSSLYEAIGREVVDGNPGVVVQTNGDASARYVFIPDRYAQGSNSKWLRAKRSLKLSWSLYCQIRE